MIKIDKDAQDAMARWTGRVERLRNDTETARQEHCSEIEKLMAGQLREVTLDSQADDQRKRKGSRCFEKLLKLDK